INNLYLVERRDIISTIFSNAVWRAPLLVIITLISFLLPIAAVFTPASLSVATAPSHSTPGGCTITTGDFSSSDAAAFHQGGILLSGFTPTVQKLAESAFYGGTIVPLPASCGQNCTYFLSVDSFTFSCQTKNVTLPEGQMGTFDVNNPGPGVQTFWNATLTGSETDHDPTMPFYVGWATGATVVPFDSSVGSSGAALCTPMQARYDFKIQKTNGLQAVWYSMTPTGPMLVAAEHDSASQQPSVKALQLGGLALATRELLLGSLSVMTNPVDIVWSFNSTARAASFLGMGYGDQAQFIWGDVPKGIEQTAANVTASMLNMNLGMQNATCMYTQAELVYSYHQPNLWAPYGIALFVATTALIVGIVIFLRYNPNNLTTSFTDTVGLTRHRDLDAFAQSKHGDGERHRPIGHFTKFKLGDVGSGYLGYGSSEKWELDT
ncbi:hypothetical protein FRB90_002122, partial [Tulasnella sp. 427]